MKKIGQNKKTLMYYEVGIKNRTTYYFDDITNLEDSDLNNILIDKNLCKIFFIYDISCKTLLSRKPLLIRFNKLDASVRIYDRTRYLTLFGTEHYDATYNGIRYLISLKISITYIFLTILQKSKLVPLLF